MRCNSLGVGLHRCRDLIDKGEPSCFFLADLPSSKGKPCPYPTSQADSSMVGAPLAVALVPCQCPIERENVGSPLAVALALWLEGFRGL